MWASRNIASFANKNPSAWEIERALSQKSKLIFNWEWGAHYKNHKPQRGILKQNTVVENGWVIEKWVSLPQIVKLAIKAGRPR
mgnify:CR=1 FL=1|jgi:hypothetical protein